MQPISPRIIANLPRLAGPTSGSGPHTYSARLDVAKQCDLVRHAPTGLPPKLIQFACEKAISQELTRGPRRGFAFYCFTTSMPRLLRSAQPYRQKKVKKPSTAGNYLDPVSAK